MILVAGLITSDVEDLMLAGSGCRILESCVVRIIIHLLLSQLCRLLECSRMRLACLISNSLSCYALNVACLISNDDISNG